MKVLVVVVQSIVQVCVVNVAGDDVCNKNGLCSNWQKDCTVDLTEGRILCGTRNTLRRFPRMVEHGSQITNIELTDQHKLKSLEYEDLQPYPNLQNLTVRYSGLQEIKYRTFASNEQLVYIDFRDNHLRLLNWTSLQDNEGQPLRITLKLDKNPWECDCVNQWIPLSVTNCSSDAFSLCKHKVPEIEGDSRVSLTIQEEKPATLKCNFTEANNYIWDIPKDHQGTTEAHENKLTIIPNREDSGKSINCLVWNEAGWSTKTFILDIQFPPKIINITQEMHLPHCWLKSTVLANPKPNTTWVHNGVVLSTLVTRFCKAEEDDPTFIFTCCIQKGPLGTGNMSLRVANALGSDTIDMTTIEEPSEILEKIRSHHSTLINSKEKVANITVAVALTGIGTLGVLAIVARMLFYRYYSTKRRHRFNSPLKIPFVNNEFYHRNRSDATIGTGTTATNLTDLIPEPQLQMSLNIPRFDTTQLQFLEKLGEGNFGIVYKGVLKFEPSRSQEVAVKVVKSLKTVEQQQIYHEAELHYQCNHPNILKIIGVVEDNITGIISEYMPYGDLCNYLRQRSPDLNYLIPQGDAETLQPLTLLEGIKLARQIAQGLTYLAENHFIHRDLAARNCLVGEDLLAKIGDFGMSKDVYSSDYYTFSSSKTLVLPVRWMPPESLLYSTFSTNSDIWSFGVLLWEIFSHGKQPWHGKDNGEVLELIKNRERLPPPTGCPEAINQIMLGCWRWEPQCRIQPSHALSLLQEEEKKLLRTQSRSHLEYASIAHPSSTELV